MVLTLKQIKQRLQEILNNWNWRTDQETKGNIHYLKISGLIKMRQIIDELSELNLFNSLTNELKNSGIFTTIGDSLTLQYNEGLTLSGKISLLKTLLDNFEDALLNTVPQENINSINIKLPEINDFNDLSIVSRDIHIALTQVIINDDINGQTNIVSVENGSIWFNVFVGAAAISVVASLAWSAAVIYKKFLEGKLLEQQIRGLTVRNDSLEDILKAQKAQTEHMIQAEAEHINSEHFKTNQPENIERIKNSIKIFAELISKGAEIHPALVAPEQVSNLFPDTNNIIGLESKIKRIGSSQGN